MITSSKRERPKNELKKNNNCRIMKYKKKRVFTKFMLPH